MPNLAIGAANAPVEFQFQTNTVRTVAIDGDVWFCASDVCSILGYSNAPDTISKHCKTRGIAKRDTPSKSGIQQMLFINEPNLYRLVIRSKMPAAQKFEEWVMEEVLPAIRKTGSYTQTISLAQQGELATLIAERFPDSRPYAWSRFNNHFRLASYKHLPSNRFNEAVEYISQMPMSPEKVIGTLKGKTLKLDIGYNGKIHCEFIEEKSPYEGLAKAIADPSNIGLETETILEIGQACMAALAERVKRQTVKIQKLTDKIRDIDPDAFKLPFKA